MEQDAGWPHREHLHSRCALPEDGPGSGVELHTALVAIPVPGDFLRSNALVT